MTRLLPRQRTPSTKVPAIEEETEEESRAREARVASAVRTEPDTRAMKEVTSLTTNRNHDFQLAALKLQLSYVEEERGKEVRKRKGTPLTFFQIDGLLARIEELEQQVARGRGCH